VSENQVCVHSHAWNKQQTSVATEAPKMRMVFMQTYFKLVWTEPTRDAVNCERFNPLRGRSCQFHSLLSHINTVTNQTKDNQTRTKRGIRASRDCSLPGSKIWNVSHHLNSIWRKAKQQFQMQWLRHGIIWIPAVQLADVLACCDEPLLHQRYHFDSPWDLESMLNIRAHPSRIYKEKQKQVCTSHTE